MTTGRRSAFVIYDEVAFKEFRQHLFDTNQDASHYIWSLILQDLSRVRLMKETPQTNTTLSSFAQITPPPRIIEDFEHVIRPYMNKSTEEEIKLAMDNGYRQYIYGRYCVIAAHKNILSHDDRKTREITYVRAERGLEHIENISGISFVRRDKL